MNKKILIIVGIVFLLLVLISQIIFNSLFPPLDAYVSERWFDEEIKMVVIAYLKQNENITGDIRVNKFHYTNYDYDIIIKNQEHGTKEYPYTHVSAIAETENFEYTVYLFVDSNGKLQVEKYEKQEKFNFG